MSWAKSPRDGSSRADSTDLLPPELLERLGSLDLVARTIVRGFISGPHRSPFLGSGEDFSRHRAYQQGDDVRRLDWRLYGRTDRLYVRLFQEDSNLQGFLLVDASQSMAFAGGGPVSKLRYAQFVAAALAHVMLRGGDAPGLSSFGEDTAFHLPPRNRPGHLHDLLLGLERLKPEGVGRASSALSEVGGALRRRGRVILLSDCLEVDDGASLLGAVGRLRARGDEVIVIRIVTPESWARPMLGRRGITTRKLHRARSMRFPGRTRDSGSGWTPTTKGSAAGSRSEAPSTYRSPRRRPS